MRGVYYNENDEFCVAWLRTLMRERQIPEGEIDARSIALVRPDDVRGFVHCHWFAGIGGWPLALRLAGWPADRPVWTGSCPCQPFSVIGRHRGEHDIRHLWPVWSRLIEECRPAEIFGEQVGRAPGLRWLTRVRADLEDTGYAVGAADLCAAGVGAPHRRQRLYFVAHTERPRLEGLAGHGDDRDESRRVAPATDRPASAAGPAGVDPAGLDAVSLLRRLDVHDSRQARRRLPLPADREVDRRSVWERFDVVACADGWRRAESGLFPLAHGVSQRVGRLRAYGNAIVPQVGAAFIQAYLAI